MWKEIEIQGERAQALVVDGSRDAMLACRLSGIVCDGVLDHGSGRWWITFLSPARGLHQAAPGDVVIRFPSNEFFAITEATFHEVATVLDGQDDISGGADRQAV